jgi:uncharacterized protein (TIGR00725 family)
MGAGEGATPESIRLAEELGRRVAEAGWVVLTGGRNAGVMAAANRGAKAVPQSLTVGILPSAEEDGVSRDVDIAILTGMGNARNAINVLSSHVVVTCGALGAGTASEAALALKSGRRLVMLAPQPTAANFFVGLGDSVEVAATPAEAIALIEKHLRSLPSASPPAPRRMRDFPDVAKSEANRIAADSQFTQDVEGYVFDGAGGQQVALWTAHADRVSEEHTHPFDEYVFVIEGRCAVLLEGERIELRAGDEFVVPKGTPQRMEVAAGTRTIHVFGGKRAQRAVSN